MTPPFPPQFFILVGIDIFLGGSIAVVTFDEHFPTGLPYLMDFGALLGFVQLVLGLQYIVGYPAEMQFYYCVTFSTTAVLAVLGCNVYVVFVRDKRAIGEVLAISATMPSILAMTCFVSAYANGVLLALPTLPLLPWPIVWGAFIGASALIVAALAVTARGKRIGKLRRKAPESQAFNPKD